jgi:hypothetical protein
VQRIKDKTRVQGRGHKREQGSRAVYNLNGESLWGSGLQARCALFFELAAENEVIRTEISRQRYERIVQRIKDKTRE